MTRGYPIVADWIAEFRGPGAMVRTGFPARTINGGEPTCTPDIDPERIASSRDQRKRCEYAFDRGE
jgi:hypothetical protein